MKPYLTVLTSLALASIANAQTIPFPEPGQHLDARAAAEPTLNAPTREEARRRVLNWLEKAYPNDEKKKAAVETVWKANGPVVESVLNSYEAADTKAKAFLNACRDNDFDSSTALAEKLLAPNADPFFKTNLGQVCARALVQHRLYDEALDVYSGLLVEDSADPAEFLFFRSVSEFKLLRISEALDTLLRLEQEVGKSPQRYQAVAALMLLDIERLDEESLEQISRIMSDIKRRMDHKKVGKKVQEEEEEVIARLDKIIKKLEQQGQGGGAGSGGGSPRGGQGAPAQDSMLLRGKGAGRVEKKALRGTSNWGSLPEKERVKMLQEMGRQFPAHYREVIEEYFRKLAEEPERESP